MFHPFRIAAVSAIALPLALLLASAAIAAAGQAESARNAYRVARYVLLAELACATLLAAAGAIYQSVAAAQERQTYQLPGKMIDIGGYRLHLYCSGNGGPTVVLDYGLVGSYLDWSYVQPEAAKFTRVCSYDRAGYGWSERSPKPRIPSVMAQELHTLLTNAGVTPPYIIVGHSFGAFNALAFAKLFARETAGVILIDGSHPGQILTFRWQDKLWLGIMQWTMPFGLPRWRGWCGGGNPDLQGVKTAITCRAEYQRTYYRQWQAFQQASNETRALGDLGDTPLAIIARDPERNLNRPPADAGSGTAFATREARWQSAQQQLLRLSTKSIYVVAQGSGHAVPLQRPDVIVEVIRKMVEQKRSDGSAEK